MHHTGLRTVGPHFFMVVSSASLLSILIFTSLGFMN